MATTTTNYGFDIPQSTDLVKDGATAIATLGQDIDTAMNTALGTKKAGMVLLNTTSFSAVASQSINDVFSSTYDNYLIVCDITSSTDQEVFFRLRASGSDLTSNVYRYGSLQLGIGIASALSAVNNTLNTNILMLNNGSGFSAGFVADLIAPNKAQAKFFNSQSTGRLGYWNAYQIQQATAYTGFTLYCTAATTITGRVSVYGYSI